ncbi:MAG: hypothetical protein M1817_006384 [Caeruleum heppii]|nr:MAG: hypothetical protein M1817_006384 [Caeruleum heppii]
MPSVSSWIRLLAVLLVGVHLVASWTHGLAPRQDRNAEPLPSLTSTETPSDAQQSSQPTTTDNSSNSENGPTSTALSGTATATPSTSPTPTDAAESPTSETARSATNGGTEQTSTSSSTSSAIPIATNGPDPNILPLPPSLTPAIAIAGVLLLCTGLPYLLVGIKNRLIQIFISTTYLVSLSVTVLILYVVNPPISNAVQGAYLVAIVLTGIIFGAVSDIFPEITEGLGCLLGGFSLSMWLLVLRPGGVLTSVGAKAIFIAAFSAAVFGFSFNRHTRPYALIAGTSWSGATAGVLGIDCFSRAGLKEFWVYLWALNEDIFPLFTNTYPLTRGMKVEIGVIVPIFLFGLVSQMKLWKIIKARHERKAAERLEDDRNLDELEGNVGRKVEHDAQRERQGWEATYGDKKQSDTPGRVSKADSGFGEDSDHSRKPSGEFVEGREVGNIDSTTDLIERLPAAQSSGATKASHRGSKDSSEQSDVSVTNDLRGTHSTETAQEPQSTVTLGPPVVPLPFRVPGPSGNGVAAARSNDDHGDDIEDHCQSSVSDTRNVSARRVGRYRSSAYLDDHSEDTAQGEDDRASSVAATIDELTEQFMVSARTTPIPMLDCERTEADTPESMQDCRRASTASLGAEGESHIRRPVSNLSGGDSNESQAQPTEGMRPTGDRPTGLDRPETDALPSPNARPDRKGPENATPLPDEDREDNRQTADGAAASTHMARDAENSRTAQSTPALTRSSSRTPSLKYSQDEMPADLKNQLPRRVSKPMMTYRTNEWAKHLDAAEKPDIEEIELLPTDLSQVENVQDLPVRVDTGALGATPEKAQLPRATRAMSSTSSLLHKQSDASHPNPDASSEEQSPEPLGQSSSLGHHHQVSPQRSGSQASLRSNKPPQAPKLRTSNSQSSINGRGYRRSSAPSIGQTLVESPTEEGYFTPPQRLTPSPMPQNTLIAKRDTLVRNKFSSMSFTPLSSTPELVPSDSASTHNSRLSTLDEDEMPLSERKSMIQSRHTSVLSPSWPLPPSTLPPHRSTTPMDDHLRRESMLAQWRASVNDDLTRGQTPDLQAAEQRRAEMISDRQRSQLVQQHRQMGRQSRDRTFDERMRSSRDMQELHREAMRKMQRQADQHA